MITLNSTTSFSLGKRELGRENQDSILPLKKKDSGWLMAIADGVGSYEGAADISSFIIDSLSELRFITHQQLKHDLLPIIKHDFLKKGVAARGEMERAATTLTVCFLDEEGLSIWHVGDCRVYLRNDKKLVQVTTDHSQYQKLLDMGLYTKRELASMNINKNQLTTAVGKWVEIIPDTIFIPSCELKDTFGTTLDIILMSDGAHHFWDLRRRFAESTMTDIVKFGNALKRRIERVEPIDDYSLVSASFDISKIK